MTITTMEATFITEDGFPVRLAVLDADTAAAMLYAAGAEESGDVALAADEAPVDLLDDNTNPVWVVDDNEGIYIAELPYVLELLQWQDRQAAIDAHMSVLSELINHHAELVAALSNDGDDQQWVPSGMCVGCVADPGTHADVLAEAIATRSVELAEAIAMLNVTLTYRPDAAA